MQPIPIGWRYTPAMPARSDRTTLEGNLAEAERRIADGLKHICHQKEVIAQLELDQHREALEPARSLLKTLIESQTLHVEERDRIRAGLLQSEAL